MSDKPTSAAEVPGFQQLTPREQAFVQHPDVFKDPRKAATDVGYASSTIEKRSHSMRQRLMRFIRPEQEARLEVLGVDRRRVEEELAAIGFVDVMDYKERIDIEMADGGFQTVVVWKDPSSLPSHMRRAIKSVEWGTETTADDEVIQSDRPIHIVFHSKEKALHELAGLFGDVAPTNPVDDQNNLLDHLNPKEREVVLRYYNLAMRRAAGPTPVIEGEYADRNEAVRRIETPSDPSSDRPRRSLGEGGEVPRDQPADDQLPVAIRGVRRRTEQPQRPESTPRRARSSPILNLDEDSDVGYRDLPG